MTDPPLHPGFHDYFSADSSAYAEFRPSYPDVLFEYLALPCPHRDQAWDAGTGSGQAAVALARHFESVSPLMPARASWRTPARAGTVSAIRCIVMR